MTEEKNKEAPFVQINTQYVKDLSFEAPNNPNSLIAMKQPPEISINVDVKGEKFNEENSLYTVNLSIKAEAKDKETKKDIFLCELEYGALVTLKVPAEQVEPFLLVEIPHLMFPAVRNIISDATRDGGFPPLMINPIDFSAIYRQRIAEKQKAEKAN
ncbi:MAG: protein-export chaperone SecB [Alphaproteobacteria bacterium]|nr:protein-export chaperone SecB [Alphaproteobacteria bacterium]